MRACIPALTTIILLTTGCLLATGCVVSETEKGPGPGDQKKESSTGETPSNDKALPPTATPTAATTKPSP